MSVGNVNSSERGTGARFNDGKPAFDLLPLFVLTPALEVLDYGRRKYAAWNWCKGQPYSVVMASMLRHLSAFQAGEDTDPESGLSHVGHILCNALFLSFMWLRCRDMDDRPEQITEAYHDVRA